MVKENANTGAEYVQGYERDTFPVEDKGCPSETGRIYNGRLISTDRMTDLIEMTKLDYRLGWIF
jgi:hypothetical protein